MGKYERAEQSAFDVFASAAWKAMNISAFPRGYKGDFGNPPYVLITLVYGDEGVNAQATSGVLMIEIYTAWGTGPRPSTKIADQLDTVLQKKTIANTQFFESTLTAYEQDKDNLQLGRRIYSIPFSHFGA